MNDKNTHGIADSMIGKYCIVRTRSAGVFAGVLERMEDQQSLVSNARRLWRWSGAASLSQLANSGTSDPNECKFPLAVPEVLLTEVIEIIPCSHAAQNSITSVPVWSA